MNTLQKILSGDVFGCMVLWVDTVVGSIDEGFPDKMINIHLQGRFTDVNILKQLIEDIDNDNSGIYYTVNVKWESLKHA